MIKMLIGLCFTVLSFVSYSQDVLTLEEPVNKNLIDSLIKVSRFDEYYVEYCTHRIRTASREKKWTEEEIQERISRVNFVNFMDYTMYNALSILSEDELNDMIAFISKLNQEKKTGFFVFTNTLIEKNLEIYVQSSYLK